MAAMDKDWSENVAEDIESKLDEADRQAATTDFRLSHEEVFSSIWKGLSDGEED